MAEIKYLDLTGLQRYDQKIKEVVNTGLDSKIGKDDAMLSVMMGPETIQATATGNKTHVIIPANNYWEVKFTNFPYNVELYEYVDGTPTEGICPVLDYGDGKLTNDNGKVVASHFALDEYQIDTNKEYALVFNYGNGEHADFTITLGIEHEEVINVQQSLSYLNDTKADKTEVDQKIGKDDAMLYGTREPASTYSYVVSNWEDAGPDGSQPMPYVIGEIWKMETDPTGAPLMLCDSDGNNIYDLPTQILGPDGEYYGSVFHIITHDNGSLSIDSVVMDVANQETQLEIDPNKAYILKLKTSDESHRVNVGIEGDVITQYNTQESLNYLNSNKADKTEVESSLALKADNTALALKADNTALALKADKTEVDTKIGKDDEMLIVSFEPTTNTTTYSGQGSFTTNLVNGTNWTVECTLNHDHDSINFVLLDQEEVFSNELGGFKQKLILTNVNGTLTINKDEQIRTITIDPSKSYKLYALDIYVDPSSHVDVTINQGGDAILNTQKSLSYLNENKADKSDIKEILLGEHDLGDSVIFHDSDSVKDGQGVTGGIPLEPGYVYFSTISEFDISDDSYDKKLIGIVAGFDNKANSWDIPTAVSQLSNDAGYAVAGDLKIAEVTEGLGENVAKAYKFEGGAESAVIEIPKDQTLKSVELGKIVDDAFVVDPTGEILRFTYIIADGSEKVVDVNVSNLITEAELDPVYDLIDTKLNAADVLTVSNDEIDAMFA